MIKSTGGIKKKWKVVAEIVGMIYREQSHSLDKYSIVAGFISQYVTPMFHATQKAVQWQRPALCMWSRGLKRAKTKKDVSSCLVGTMLHPHWTREDRAEPARIHRGQWSWKGLQAFYPSWKSRALLHFLREECGNPVCSCGCNGAPSRSLPW